MIPHNRNKYHVYFLGAVSIILVNSFSASGSFFYRSKQTHMLNICSLAFNEQSPTSDKSVWLEQSDSESLFSFSDFAFALAVIEELKS